MTKAAGIKDQNPSIVWDDETEEQAAEDYIQQHLTKTQKGNGLWKPPHNLLLNRALMGYNLWVFTILPFGGAKRAYREDLNGLVIQPIWTSLSQGRTLGSLDMSGFSHLDIDTAEKLVQVINDADTISQTVAQELRAIETANGIKIPSTIEAVLMKDALPTAARRWGVDRLRVKKRLIPLDGSKPRDLGSFD